MSYDVSIHTAGSMADPNPPPLGPRVRVVQVLESAFPALKWTDSAWGEFADDQGSAEINLGGDDPIPSFAVHLRGIFAGILEKLDSMARGQGWEVFDWQDDGEDFDA